MNISIQALQGLDPVLAHRFCDRVLCLLLDLVFPYSLLCVRCQPRILPKTCSSEAAKYNRTRLFPSQPDLDLKPSLSIYFLYELGELLYLRFLTCLKPYYVSM